VKRVLLVTTLLAAALLTGSSASIAAPAAQSFAVKSAPLEPVGGSGVSGRVVLIGLPQGTLVLVGARGLTPGNTYTSFYYDDNQCQVDPEAVGTFRANRAGFGFTGALIDEDLDEVGSISVRTPNYAVLFACAHLQSVATTTVRKAAVRRFARAFGVPVFGARH
jgi:arginine/lysine/ornithine decarboxylase